MCGRAMEGGVHGEPDGPSVVRGRDRSRSGRGVRRRSEVGARRPRPGSAAPVEGTSTERWPTQARQGRQAGSAHDALLAGLALGRPAWLVRGRPPGP
jgi:hypothetical protein